VSHLTNTSFIARLSSAGQFEEATSQTLLPECLQCDNNPLTLPFNIPHKKKLTCVQIRWTGRANSPANYFVAPKKTQRTVGCSSTKSIKSFLIKRMFSTRSVPVWNINGSRKLSACLQILFLFGPNFLWTHYTTSCCTVFG